MEKNQQQKKKLAPQGQVKQYLVTEVVANEILARLAKAPWDIANPIINLIQGNFMEFVSTVEEKDKSPDRLATQNEQN